ncbi:MAG: hypothetical protein Q9174_000665 [Haloplaca sp. 1 TL-2023]
MAPNTSVFGASHTNDNFDDPSAFDVDFDDILRDIDGSTNLENPGTDVQTESKGTNHVLGIDKEVEIVKKRQPIAKLDDKRLLSQSGIPKLRRIAKDRFKFKGKGHEYSDLARLLNIYQLWLDDLYPRAKFADALAIIEKLGHSKRIQVMRREWISEGKPREAYDGEDASRAVSETTRPNQETARPIQEPRERASNKGEEGSVKTHKRQSPGLDDEDLYAASPLRRQEDSDKRSSTALESSLFLPGDTIEDRHPEDDLDDLDALLAEDDVTDGRRAVGSTASHLQTLNKTRTADDFDDEMEAMADMGMW